jgi:hypothetical protein
VDRALWKISYVTLLERIRFECSSKLGKTSSQLKAMMEWMGMGGPSLMEDYLHTLYERIRFARSSKYMIPWKCVRKPNCFYSSIAK